MNMDRNCGCSIREPAPWAGSAGGKRRRGISPWELPGSGLWKEAGEGLWPTALKGTMRERRERPLNVGGTADTSAQLIWAAFLFYRRAAGPAGCGCGMED